MDLEKHITPATVQRIYAFYANSHNYEHRPHLGGSQIGRACARALHYQFRWADRSEFEPRVLRLFQTGHREEARLIDDLRNAGFTVWDRDPDDPEQQIGFSLFGGHFRANLDGVVAGLPESRKPHTLEIKTMNDKNFKAWQKEGVEEAKPVYYAQCQIGMHLAKLDRCLFLVVNKNDDTIGAERVNYNRAKAEALIERARSIIFAESAPAQLSSNPEQFICRTCEFRDVCHHGKPPEVNCRTCAHSTPEPDGTWSCRLALTMWQPCPSHIFSPTLLSWPAEDAGARWIDYRAPDGATIRNRENSEDFAKMWTPF